ncbi:MAG TPA: BTAD domain-containing putative transcriptional regulator [Chloroflexota bacterium]|jgi:DNA-binding SARP family transcriptional activator
MPQGEQLAGASRADSPIGQVSVRCLGDFEVTIGGERLARFGSGKARALLQYLLNHPNQTVSRGVLIGALWPDPDAGAAGSSLRVAVHALRRMLHDVPADEVGLSIEGNSTGYQLSVNDLWLDVDEFTRCCARGRELKANNQHADSIAEYARAATLYRGDYLDGANEAWVQVRREGLKDQYVFVLELLAETALDRGDYEGCILHSLQLLEQDRWRESTYRMLMDCHARLGQRGRVRSWYELCAQTLRSELDIAPDEQTEALYQRAMGAV